ncbi:ABC transporter permease [Candidatus Woesearchaeota archaeon]|nr:ABC transporter permease [Candidatus Woesearchaeota archaeon]
MLNEYFNLALKNLLKRKLRSWLTMIGIFIGIAAVVSLIGLGQGLRNAVIGQFSFLGTDFITVQAGGVQFGPPGSGVVKPLTKDDVEDLNDVNGVKFAIGRLIKTGKTEFDDKVSFNFVGSMPDGEQRKEVEKILGIKAEKGRLLKDGDRLKVVVGNHLLNKDHLGEKLKIGSKILVQGKQFEVVGILESRGSFIIDTVVFMNIDTMREVFDKKDDVSAILVKTRDGANMNIVKENIEKVLRRTRKVDEGEEDFRAELAANNLAALDSTLFAVQLFVYIIAGISLVVGGIGIMNTMYTAVIERTKEIGIMKSIGAKNEDVFILFFFESGLLGMVGGIIGIGIGVGLAKGLAYIGSLQLGSNLIQANISFGLIVGALLFSYLIGSLAGILPAVQASKLSPVEALRYAK